MLLGRSILFSRHYWDSQLCLWHWPFPMPRSKESFQAEEMARLSRRVCLFQGAPFFCHNEYIIAASGLLPTQFWVVCQAFVGCPSLGHPQNSHSSCTKWAAACQPVLCMCCCWQGPGFSTCCATPGDRFTREGAPCSPSQRAANWQVLERPCGDVQG